ncbi:N,N'-diacetylbacillosaminyl-diphospho-undecaprenol alpha-1,3-N-acetylgalactosaminyltransferase [Fuerstiella marisgermanici]|uniref:N, N'-diacetylbacillosaminyl-diphospho-undecaprenol alpha-1,3-N-acetylgalactosaminyltransferase n=2 Tax=Fuerstiella marisgermanici TaxID=1891926 RepID=A0A1P8WN26_9PLAN|nr:N,N'-diacetylbacillosaminyl-diphospho-undecaprenol alpha-1,3-N-acetylgalactosaminyltransferase [Fuerstiella marisgermanici]
MPHGSESTMPLPVKFFQRKTRPSGNFSLEFVFEDVRNRLAGRIVARICEAPFYSNGLLRRFAILVHAFFCQDQRHLNHVTGDTTFTAVSLNKQRTILTILDCGAARDGVGIKQTIIRKLWFEWPAKRAACVTTISDSVKREIVELTGCCPDKVHVVPVAVSDAFRPHPKEFNVTKPRILHVGCAPNKNLPRLIDALTNLECTLVVVGKVDESTVAKLGDCNIDYEVHINLTLPEVVQQYVNADMLSFVSTYEGFGMPIVEAQSVGRPVVTSQTSSMPEVAGDGACFVDPLDVNSIRRGIERVIADASYRSTLIENGMKNAKRFNPDVIAEQYLSLYCQFWPTCDQENPSERIALRSAA